MLLCIFFFLAFPVFTKRPSNITVQAKKNIRLDCAVDGDPKPNMYWQFNFGDDFPAARERRMHVMPGDDTFFISDAKLSDQGIYTCTAQNTAGIIGANATVVIRKYIYFYLILCRLKFSVNSICFLIFFFYI